MTDEIGADDYDAELEDADSTALLAFMAQELTEIRHQLQVLNSKADTEHSAPLQYECGMCHSRVSEDERERHLAQEHGAPPNISPDDVFEPYERNE